MRAEEKARPRVFLAVAPGRAADYERGISRYRDPLTTSGSMARDLAASTTSVKS